MTEYRYIDGFPGYRIGNDGSFQSLWVRNGLLSYMGETWKNLKLSDGGQGYSVVTMYCGKNKRRARVHRLVAEAFIENPYGYPIVRHLNGVRDDNRISNLAWGTNEDNYRDSVDHGTAYQKAPPPIFGERHPNAVLSDDAAVEIFLSRDVPGLHFVKKYCVSQAVVSGIRRGKCRAKVISERVGADAFNRLSSIDSRYVIAENDGRLRHRARRGAA